MTRNRKAQLAGIIETHPGLGFRDLMRFTGMKNGVLSYHLDGLERSGSITAIRSARQSRFYPPGIPEQESRIIRALRRTTPRAIIESLILHDTLPFGDIVRHARKSPSTVSVYLSQLVQDGIVGAVQAAEGRSKTYRLADPGTVGGLIEDYRPGLLDRHTSGLEEIINPL